jgi:hypothetical protein
MICPGSYCRSDLGRYGLSGVFDVAYQDSKAGISMNAASAASAISCTNSFQEAMVEDLVANKPLNRCLSMIALIDYSAMLNRRFLRYMDP